VLVDLGIEDVLLEFHNKIEVRYKKLGSEKGRLDDEKTTLKNMC